MGVVSYISGFVKCQVMIPPLSTGTWPYHQHPLTISALYSIWHLNCQSKLLFGIYIVYLYYSHRDNYKWLSCIKVCFIKKKPFTCIYYKAIDYNPRAYKYPNIFLWVWAYLLLLLLNKLDLSFSYSRNAFDFFHQSFTFCRV